MNNNIVWAFFFEQCDITEISNWKKKAQPLLNQPRYIVVSPKLSHSPIAIQTLSSDIKELKAKTSVFVVILLLLFSGMESKAQERAGDVLKTFEQKDRVPIEKPIVLPVIEQIKPMVLPVPVEDEHRKIHVTSFKIEGATLIDATAFASVTSPLENKELSLPEIMAAADAITALYHSEGYVIANALVPEQDIRNGVVVIRVVEGKIGTINVTGNKSYTYSFIKSHLERVNKDPSLKEERLERSLLLLNDFTSLNVRALLKAGNEPGSTDVIATVIDTMPIGGSISYDNYGSDTLGKQRLSLSVELGNLLNSGDQIMLRGTTGLDRIDFNKLSYGRFEYLLPVGYDGIMVNMYYANSLYRVGGSLAELDINGKAHTAGFSVAYPLIKKTETTLSGKAGFDYKDIYDYLLGDRNSKDYIRMLNLGIAFDGSDRLEGRNLIGLNYYVGIANFLGGSGTHDLGTSRSGAGGNFSKITLDLTRVQKLLKYNHLILRGSGQYSHDKLFTAEQFSLGGAGSVRGFKPSQQNGDCGYFISAELHLSPFISEPSIQNQKVGDMFKFVLFSDHGGVFRNTPQSGEADTGSLTSIGAGVRFYYGSKVSFSLDCAFPEIHGGFNLQNKTTYFQTVVHY